MFRKDRIIEQQARTIACLTEVINSLEEDLKSAREVAFESKKNPLFVEHEIADYR